MKNFDASQLSYFTGTLMATQTPPLMATPNSPTPALV